MTSLTVADHCASLAKRLIDLLPAGTEFALIYVPVDGPMVTVDPFELLIGHSPGEETGDGSLSETEMRQLVASAIHANQSAGGSRVYRGCLLEARPVDAVGTARALGHVAILASRNAGPERVSAAVALCAAGLVGHVVEDATQATLERVVQEQKAIIDNITDGLLVLDQDGVVRFMNHPAGRILSLIPDRSIGRPLAELLQYELNVAPIFRTGIGYVDRETIRDLPNRHLHLLDTAVPITNAAGRVVSVVNTFREINTVRRQTHSMLGSHARYSFGDIIGRSPAITRAIALAKKAAAGRASVMLTGESGTGKEIFAQALHAGSDRRDGPFIAINCAALPRDLIESELFGYQHGSFTGAQRGGRAGKFELASGGTLFLDEIGEMPLDVQAKLLRVLQEREVVRIGDTRPIPVDVRVVAASNRDLGRLIAERQFREDLFFRINVIEIPIPPLRERIEDIPVLANHFLRKYASALNRAIFRISDRALAEMRAYVWPGNVRELQNTMERLVNLTEGVEIDVFHAPVRDESQHRRSATGGTSAITLAQAERDLVAWALSESGYNLAAAARALGIGRATLYAKVKRHKIDVKRRMRRD